MFFYCPKWDHLVLKYQGSTSKIMGTVIFYMIQKNASSLGGYSFQMILNVKIFM